MTEQNVKDNEKNLELQEKKIAYKGMPIEVTGFSSIAMDDRNREVIFWTGKGKVTSNLSQYTGRWTVKKKNRLQTFSDLHRWREFSTPTFTERITKVYTSAKGKIKEGKKN